MMTENKNESNNSASKSAKPLIQDIKEGIGAVVVGMPEVVEHIIAALLVNGHILLEGVPGTAKTLLAKTLAALIDCDFKRIQFTPDLMPADLTGTSMYNMGKNEFIFSKGPLFTNIVLADEINRAPAKTQSSLFEVMEERQITADGKTYHMEEPYIVIATQNPIEYEGTYRLPEAQLDRFVMKIAVGYPSVDEELEILERFDSVSIEQLLLKVKKAAKKSTIKNLRQKINEIHVEKTIMQYIVKIVNATRNNSGISFGASPRASLALMNIAKAFAILDERDFVVPEDIIRASLPVLRHRIILTPEKEVEGVTPDEVINSIIKKIEVPR